MIAVLFASGFEEIEAITVVDVLRRAGLDVRMLGVGGKTITGAHQISIVCDDVIECAKGTFEMLVLPGGMPGADNLNKSESVQSLIAATYNNGGYLAAICAAPLILGQAGLLNGRKAVCFPGFEQYLKGAEVVCEEVMVDGRIITSRGAGAALPFAYQLVSLLKDPTDAKALSKSMLYE